MTKLHSKTQKFANPDLQKIDFEIRQRTWSNFSKGFFLYFLIILIAAVFLLTLPGSLCLLGLVLFFTMKFWRDMFVPLIKLHRRAKKFSHNSARLLHDRRAPILYLRSFNVDIQDVNVDQRLSQRTPEEFLVSVVSKAGPVVAVGRPGEEGLPLLGASRVYMNEDWRFQVEKFMDISQLIIINAYDTENVLWELEKARQIVKPERLIVSFFCLQELGGFESFYERFEKDFKHIFFEVLPPYDPHTCFIYFNDDWKPVAVSILPIQTFKIEAQAESYEYIPRWKIKKVFRPLIKELKKHRFNESKI